MKNTDVEGVPGDIIIVFDSGRMKKIKGDWKSGKDWVFFEKKDGGFLHVNKNKVEYMETFE